MGPLSALLAASRHGSGRIRLGFLGGSLFRYENPRFELLDLFGFRGDFYRAHKI